MTNTKPLGRKSYGSIGHLPNSRLGPGDHAITDGQAAILTVKTRDRHDLIIVQEKLDGSNVGVAKLNREIDPYGVPASSPYLNYDTLRKIFKYRKHFFLRYLLLITVSTSFY